MAQLSRTNFKSLYGSSGTTFPDNTTGEISESDMRQFGEDDADSHLNRTDDVIDEDDMSSNSATKVPTQQSVKAYVDAAALGIVTSWKAPVKVATTANGTLASDFENGDTIDGVALVTGDRILLKNQSSQSENGIYIVAASGAPSRSSDANVASELEGAAVTVQQGTSNANTTWIQTTDGVTLGSSNIVFAQLGASVPDAAESTKGIAELSTQAENNTGTDDARIITPLKLKNLDRDSSALSDGATIDITGPKHTLSTSSSRTFTISFVGDKGIIVVTLSAVSATQTFPSGWLCVSDGVSSGDNTLTMAGTSGDKYVIAWEKVGSEYYAVCKNFGQ